MNGLDKVIEHLNHAHLDALLNPPTDDMILEHLKKEMGHIPADYIEFLKRCNGLALYHSGDYCLFDAQEILATVYKGNIIKNLIMDCQSYTKYRPNETTGGIFVSWRRKEELPTGA